MKNSLFMPFDKPLNLFRRKLQRIEPELKNEEMFKKVKISEDLWIWIKRFFPQAKKLESVFLFF